MQSLNNNSLILFKNPNVISLIRDQNIDGLKASAYPAKQIGIQFTHMKLYI